jgi:DUF4097 and DUF4098 domain-containing protein YvlB
MSYITKVYKDEGGDRQVVDAGGELLIKGKLSLAAGATINDGDGVHTVADPDDVSLEIDGESGELQIKDAGVDEDKLAATVAGAGLTGGEGDPLAVNVDDESLEVDGDSGELQIKSQDAIADLDLTATAEYTDTELQAVADKVDAILAALRAAGIIKAGA